MSKLLIVIGVSIIAVILFSGIAWAQETITITTYYPSPNGSYRELEWGDLPARSKGLLKADEGSSIELGGLRAGGAAGTPHVDFYNDMGASFDMRIKLAGDNDLEITGGRTTFRNDETSTTSSPAIIRVKEVWYCSRY